MTMRLHVQGLPGVLELEGRLDERIGPAIGLPPRLRDDFVLELDGPVNEVQILYTQPSHTHVSESEHE
jgi:hypothetical protein